MLHAPTPPGTHCPPIYISLSLSLVLSLFFSLSRSLYLYDRPACSPAPSASGGGPRKLAVCAHGIGTNLGLYTALTARLVDAGYTVLRYDYFGHGWSVPDDPLLRINDIVMLAQVRTIRMLHAVTAHRESIVCCGSVLWRCAVAVRCRGVLWRCAVAVCRGGVPWRCAVAVWRCAVVVCCGYVLCLVIGCGCATRCGQAEAACGDSIPGTRAHRFTSSAADLRSPTSLLSSCWT